MIWTRAHLWPTAGLFALILFMVYLWDSSYYPTWQKTGLARSSAKDGATTTPVIIERETVLSDGVLRYTRINPTATPNLLWLSLTHDIKSWARMSPEVGRYFKDFLSNIVTPHWDQDHTSLGMLTSSLEEYEDYIEQVKNYRFPRVSIYYHPGNLAEYNITRDNRHDDELQLVRRSEIAKLRNYLLVRALEDEKHIIWSDADVWKLQKGIVRRMIKHAEDRPDVGAINVRCTFGPIWNYDLNTFRGTRRGPRGWDLTQAEIEAGEEALQGSLDVTDLLKNTSDDDLIPVDSVGVTLLYMRSSVVLKGANFPHSNAVGTRWGKDGYDGLESEGLCYRMRGMKDGKCMLMGGDWHVDHAGD